MNYKKYLRKVIGYCLKDKKTLIIIGLTSIIITVIGIFNPFITSNFYQAITAVNTNDIIKYAAIILIIETVNIILNYISHIKMFKYDRYVELMLQADATQELFKLKQNNFDQKGTEFFLSRVLNDTRAVFQSLSRYKDNILDIISSMGVVVYIITASYKVFLLVLVMAILKFIIDYKERQVYEKQYKNRRNKREYQSSSFQELIRGIKDIKVLNLRENVTKYIIDGQQKINQINYEESKERNFYSILTSIIRSLTSFVVCIYCVYLFKLNQIPGELILIIVMYQKKFDFLLFSIESIYETNKDIKLSLSNLCDILDNDKYLKEEYGNINCEHFLGSIEFKNVEFSYTEDTPVINGLSLKINPHETVGFVGRSGAGKSTIFGLMSRLYDINSGEILIDGNNISEYNEASIRSNITVITQNPYIFNMSIKDNIKIVAPDISDEEIVNACKLAEIHDYIETLPDKYDTFVGENGVILSGGLKQRLAIARALVKKTDIILFDEATSAMDNELQNKIMTTIKNIKKDYTILIIAHRLSTVRDCDKIVVIDDGKLVGYGSHNELIKDNQIYKTLYQGELLDK